MFLEKLTSVEKFGLILNWSHLHKRPITDVMGLMCRWAEVWHDTRWISKGSGRDNSVRFNSFFIWEGRGRGFILFGVLQQNILNNNVKIQKFWLSLAVRQTQEAQLQYHYTTLKENKDYKKISYTIQNKFLPFIPILSSIHTGHTACPALPVHMPPDTPGGDLLSTECTLLVSTERFLFVPFCLCCHLIGLKWATLSNVWIRIWWRLGLFLFMLPGNCQSNLTTSTQSWCSR